MGKMENRAGKMENGVGKTGSAGKLNVQILHHKYQVSEPDIELEFSSPLYSFYSCTEPCAFNYFKRI